jgi:malate permease and related proteins
MARRGRWSLAAERRAVAGQNDVAPVRAGRKLAGSMQIVETLAPVFLVIALGWWLRRRVWLSDEFISEANRRVYWLGLPALLFISLATAPHQEAPAGPLMVMVLGATAGTIGLALLAGRYLGIGRASLGTFVQAAYRGNLAYVALPILVLLPAAHGPLYTAALLSMAPIMAFYNAAAVILLLSSHAPSGEGMAGRVVREILRNPLIWSSALGAVYGWREWPLPAWLDNSVAMVGKMSLPLALICIGGTLAATRLTGNRRRIVAASVGKLVVLPLGGWFLARLLGLSPAETQVGLVMLATPTAAASYTMATQLGGDGELAAGSVVMSTLLSLVALAAVVAWG